MTNENTRQIKEWNGAAENETVILCEAALAPGAPRPFP